MLVMDCYIAHTGELSGGWLASVKKAEKVGVIRGVTRWKGKPAIEAYGVDGFEVVKDDKGRNRINFMLRPLGAEEAKWLDHPPAERHRQDFGYWSP